MLDANAPEKQGRKPRDADTRAAVERPKQWLPPQTLPDPNPEPGYAFRWIRISTLGSSDPSNVSAKLREGWEPVKASDHPEVHVMGGSAGRFPDSIEIGGLLLCKTPIEFVQQRDAFYQRQADGQMQSVDNSFMRENDPRMPLFRERQSEVKFGRGS
jgi:hypothetical protein